MGIQGIQLQSLQQGYDSSQHSSASKPDKAENEPDKAVEVCIASTDKVDGEIARLKEKEARLSQRLNLSGESAGQEEMEKELAQVEDELRQKDNDAYRRQNAEFSSGVDVKV